MHPYCLMLNKDFINNLTTISQNKYIEDIILDDNDKDMLKEYIDNLKKEVSNSNNIIIVKYDKDKCILDRKLNIYEFKKKIKEVNIEEFNFSSLFVKNDIKIKVILDNDEYYYLLKFNNTFVLIENNKNIKNFAKIPIKEYITFNTIYKKHEFDFDNSSNGNFIKLMIKKLIENDKISLSDGLSLSGIETKLDMKYSNKKFTCNYIITRKGGIFNYEVILLCDDRIESIPLSNIHKLDFVYCIGKEI